MYISLNDRSILKRLGCKMAEIAQLPAHQKTKEMWKRLNNLNPVKPMVAVIQIPWKQMNVDDELTIQTDDEFCQEIEWQLRTKLYKWKHMPVDMVVEPYLTLAPIINDTEFGFKTEEDVLKGDEKNRVFSHKYKNQIHDMDDIQRIKTPRIIYDKKATAERIHAAQDIFDGILEVKQPGMAPSFSPWDVLVKWWGVETLFIDMMHRPRLVHAAIERLVEAYLARLDQYVEKNLLTLNNNADHPRGPGLIGYTDELLSSNDDPANVRPKNMWGVGGAQVFSEVSPRMHDEFALVYEVRWYERFGLNYYGCCEPLHEKVDILANRIPNLRKISMSPWADFEVGARNIGKDFVFSAKPNPAVLATNRWDPEAARMEVEDILKVTARYGCPVELIMKDISTVRSDPSRLWEWASIAAESAEKYIR